MGFPFKSQNTLKICGIRWARDVEDKRNTNVKMCGIRWWRDVCVDVEEKRNISVKDV